MVVVPKFPRSLEVLDIDGCKKIENLLEWFGNMVALKILEIRSFESLNTFPSSIGGLIALERLH